MRRVAPARRLVRSQDEPRSPTPSRFAEQLLVNWDREVGRFWQVVPKEMLTRLPAPLKAEQRAAEAGDD
jgi:glutamate synthase (NADPH/NADH) large chain